MLIKFIVQDVTEDIGNCIFNSTAGTHMLACFFSVFCHEKLFGLVLSSVRFLSQFYLLIKYGAITDTFLTAITHRIVWMRPQLLHILLSQTKLHLQFLNGIPKENSNLNINDMQQPHILTFFLVFCNSFAVLPAPGWCFNSDSHVSTLLQHSLISSRLQSQGRWVC